MKNLKRYDVVTDNKGVYEKMGVFKNGQYVNFSDVEEALRSTSNNTAQLAIAFVNTVVPIIELGSYKGQLNRLKRAVKEWRSATASGA